MSGFDSLLMETYTFKKIDNHEIKVDAYRIKGEEPRPAILFIHGGGLITGSRKAIVPSQIDAFYESGYHFLSIDYRLAPETALPQIVHEFVRNTHCEHAFLYMPKDESVGVAFSQIAEILQKHARKHLNVELDRD